MTWLECRVRRQKRAPAGCVVPALLLASLALGCLQDEEEHATLSPSATEEPEREERAGLEEPLVRRDPEKLRLGVVGFWGTSTHAEAFEPMASFLAEDTGRRVEIVSATGYDDLVRLLMEGELELALLPPLAYVRAREQLPHLRLLRTMVVSGAVHYSGYIIVRADSPITSSRDLSGGKMAFVERSSASGYLFARKWLAEEGLEPDRHLADSIFTGSHEDVIRAVIEGDVDAGATFQGAIKTARASGLDTGILRVLAITGRIPLDALVAAPDLDARLLERVDSSLEDINTASPRGRAALSGLVDINGWVQTDDRLYDPIRNVIGYAAGPDGEQNE